MPLTVAAVPTGIKIGVGISPWAVTRTPVLALVPISLPVILNIHILFPEAKGNSFNLLLKIMSENFRPFSPFL
jgi:hypothetical protein